MHRSLVAAAALTAVLVWMPLAAAADGDLPAWDPIVGNGNTAAPGYSPRQVPAPNRPAWSYPTQPSVNAPAYDPPVYTLPKPAPGYVPSSQAVPGVPGYGSRTIPGAAPRAGD